MEHNVISIAEATSEELSKAYLEVCQECEGFWGIDIFEVG